VVAVMTGGVHLSVRRGVSWVPVRELVRWAAGWLLLLGWFGSPGSKSFLFLFFSFFFSGKTDLSFEKVLLFRFD
jgi:hypothetical protein